MTYLTAIKHGFLTVNKNWQLIIVQFISMIVSFLSFFIIVGIPIAIAFILFGLDMTEIMRIRDIFTAFKSTTEMLHKYFLMAIIVLISLVVYVIFVLSLWVFTFGGIAGIFKNSVQNLLYRFKLKYFFKYGRLFFVRIVTYSSIVGAIFIGFAFVLGIIGGFFSVIVDVAKSQEVAFAKFITIFFSLLTGTLATALVICILSLTVYGIASIVFKNLSSIKALSETADYLLNKPSAIGFYTVLIVIYMVFALIEIFIGSLVILIPFVGSLLAVPYQTISYVLQGYIGLVMIASSFHYFANTCYDIPKGGDKI